MKIDREKNVIICRGKEYPPTMHNALIYKRYLKTNKYNERVKLMDELSEISLDI